MKCDRSLRILAASALLFCLLQLPSTVNGDDWPSLRGADRSGVAPDTNLLEMWPDGGPELVWETNGAGRGYASLAIADGKMYTLGDNIPDAGNSNEYLVCFDANTGKYLWRSGTGKPWNAGQPTWQGSRSTPTVDGDRVYVISPSGTLVCVSTDGKEQWRVNLKDALSGKKADIWGYSESVMIDGDNLICTPGGPKNTMVALNKMTGDKVWSTQRNGDRGAGHASIVMSKIGETSVCVQTTGSGAMGVRASDGKLLWTYDIDKTTAVIPTPIIRDDLVFFSAGYGRGGALLRQKEEGDGVSVEEIYPLNPKLCNKHGGIVLVGDYLYGDSDDKGRPFCAELMTGEAKWKSRGSGKKSAATVAADGHVYFRYANGMMTLVKADPTSFQEVGKFKVPGSGDNPSWAHPVVLDGKLYLREGNKVLCYNVSDGQGGGGAATADAVSANGELLTNGNFANGRDGWEVDQVDDATAKVSVVKDGPNGESAMRIEIVSAPDEPWQVQMYQPVAVEKDQTYVLKFWAKSNQGGMFKVNCMQNHEPWEHSTEEEMYLSDKWKEVEFVFDGPWDEKDGRITLTDLGNESGRVYWFTNFSLTKKK